jgi:hypothetical protein
MKPIYEAKKMFLERGLNFEEQLSWYLTNGVVLSLEDRFLMAKPIELAVGNDCLKWFFDQAPYRLPYIGWRRNKDGNNRFRVYNASTFERFA